MSNPNLFKPKRWLQICAVARQIGISDATLRQWRHRRSIPGSKHLELLRAAVKIGVALTGDELSPPRKRSRAA